MSDGGTATGHLPSSDFAKLLVVSFTLRTIPKVYFLCETSSDCSGVGVATIFCSGSAVVENVG